MKWVYRFGKGKAEGNGHAREVLGGKGAGLVEMAKSGLPVPPGFVIATDVSRYYLSHDKSYPKGLVDQVAAGMQSIESATKRKLGDPKNPLLVSVRSGAPVSMPGMMDTILNLGLNDVTVEGLIHSTDNPRFGFDSYRRFIQMYASVVLHIPHARFEEAMQAVKRSRGVTLDVALTAQDLETVVEKFQEVVRQAGQEFPQDPQQQLWGAIGAVFDSWNGKRAIEYRRISHIPDELGTGCIIQAMVFGNMGPKSATGVAFTRDPSTGANYFFGEYLPNAQGEDVVAGIRTPQPLNRRCQAASNATTAIQTLEEAMPDCYQSLETLRHTLERHYADVQDVEFTIEEGVVWMLQTRTAKRTAAAAVKIAVDLAEEGIIDHKTALLRVESAQIEQLLHPTFDDQARKAAQPLGKGLPASPGAAVGRIVFSADDAVAWHGRGDPVILVRAETSPDDIHGMYVAQGFLTTCGGVTSHAAVVARGLGKPCVVGCHTLSIDEHARQLHNDAGVVCREGDWLSLDGGVGEVYVGQLPKRDAQLTEEFRRLLSWADEYRTLGVRANAETIRDAKAALEFGAEGIGLARTEHMFFEPGRVDIVREMILAPSMDVRKRALAKLLPLQKNDLRELLAVMAGRPVTIRLLDPPLHEFLPRTEEQFAEVAQASGVSTDTVREMAAKLHEDNPMLGHRGCRLGVTFPEIYAMQIQAIMEAACELKRDEHLASEVEIEFPLVAHLNEMRQLRAVAIKVADEVMTRLGVEVRYSIGTMLELPRACIIADTLAAHADFFSFGTNDLTQTTLGISRDDAGRFLSQYIDQHILTSDPFMTIDQEGVGALMRMAVEKARKVKPKVVVGICGEHGGDPRSVAFCHGLGLNYVSCSPYRVPVARFAAAQAALRPTAK